MIELVLNHIESYLDGAVSGIQQVGGGDFAQAFQVTVSSNKKYFLKTHANPPEYFFTTEASGLRWLRDTGEVNVPEVISASDSPPHLLMEWVEIGRSSRSTEAQFGIALAKLHMCKQNEYGREDCRTTGSLALPNDPCKGWAEFYRDRRLLPLAKIAADRGTLSTQVINRLEVVAHKLEEFAPADESISLLHGDLWAGNRVIDVDGGSWLIDPAAHRGNREFDLAMMRLFGGYGEQCFSSYQNSFPLSAGWQDRVLLHQLAPLVVHAIKFGGHYVSSCETAIDTYL